LQEKRSHSRKRKSKSKRKIIKMRCKKVKKKQKRKIAQKTNSIRLPMKSKIENSQARLPEEAFLMINL
jgi:hypothetical protein